MASSVGTVASVTQLSDGDRSWDGLGNLVSNNNQNATCARIGLLTAPFQPNSLQINFNFASIPVDSDFLGMSVSVGRNRGRLLSSCSDGIVRLTSSGVPIGNNRAAGQWPLSEETITYGGQADNWGAAELENIVAAGMPGQIGLRFQPANCNNETISVDFVVASLFYRWSDIFIRQNSAWVRSYPEIQQAGVMRPPISASVRKNGVWVPIYLG